jgi:hypothetical protein
MIFAVALASALLFNAAASPRPLRQSDGASVDDEALPPGYKLPKGPRAPKAEGKEPKTCADQCDMMKETMKETCKTHKSAKKSAGGAKACEDVGAQSAQLCQDSCRAKGRIDPEYLKSHAQKPKPPPGAHTGPKPGGGQGGGTDAASSPE